jgi:hypothetical protein
LLGILVFVDIHLENMEGIHDCRSKWVPIEFKKRFGDVGLAILATVYGANNSSDEGRIVPSTIVGFRYVFMK